MLGEASLRSLECYLVQYNNNTKWVYSPKGWMGFLKHFTFHGICDICEGWIVVPHCDLKVLNKVIPMFYVGHSLLIRCYWLKSDWAVNRALYCLSQVPNLPQTFPSLELVLWLDQPLWLLLWLWDAFYRWMNDNTTTVSDMIPNVSV